MSPKSTEAAAELTGSIMIGAAAGAAISTVVGAPFTVIGIIPALVAGIPIGAAAGGAVWLGRHGIVSHLRHKQREKQYAQSKQKKGEDQKKRGSKEEAENKQTTKNEGNNKTGSTESENPQKIATTGEDHDNETQ